MTLVDILQTDIIGHEGKAFPCGRAKVSPDTSCGDTPQRPEAIR